MMRRHCSKPSAARRGRSLHRKVAAVHRRVIELQLIISTVLPVGHIVCDSYLAAVVHQAAYRIILVPFNAWHIDQTFARLAVERVADFEDVSMLITRCVPRIAAPRVLERIKRSPQYRRVVFGVLPLFGRDIRGQRLRYRC